MVRIRLLALSLSTISVVSAQLTGVPPADLDKLSVDELFRTQVTSVGRKAQELSKAPAAVFVLTAEDIRRSGAASIPEALQWVPGLTVLSIDGRSWAISARGDAWQYSNKILVMVDGLSLYMPLFSGVLWDTIGVPMEDIDRIEVVRGPGAVMWGPNAVNGVINIITKRAQQTKGTSVSIAGGNATPASAEVHYSAAPDEDLAYRISASASYAVPASGSDGTFYLLQQLPYPVGKVGNMAENAAHLDFRLDGQSAWMGGQWMVQGDLYNVGEQDPLAYGVVVPIVVDRSEGHTNYYGGYLQAQWAHTGAHGSESKLKFTYDRLAARYPYLGGLAQNMTVDFQDRRQWGARNEIYWGLGFQQYWDKVEWTQVEGFTSPRSVYRAGDAVIRDEYQLVPDRWTVSLGARVDYTSFGRFEYQPSLRVLFTPSARQSAWMAVSRAVHAPDRTDHDFVYDDGATFKNGVNITPLIYGSPSLRSEVERSLEAGYRVQSGRHWSLDTSAFWSYYNRLRGEAASVQPSVDAYGNLTIPYVGCNCRWGRSYGVEIWGTLQVASGWRLLPSYSYLNQTEWLPSSLYFLYATNSVANVPHQATLRSQHDLSRNWKFDWGARFRSHDVGWDLPGVLLWDARVSWKPSRSTEFSANLQNLTNRRLLEAYSLAATPSLLLRRTFVVQLTQKF